MPTPTPCSEISGLNSDSCGDTATHNWCKPGESCNVCYDTGAMVCSSVTPSPTDSLDGCPKNLMCSTTGKESADSGQKINYTTRNINIYNNCNDNVSIISALTGDFKTHRSEQLFESECNNTENSVYSNPISGDLMCKYNKHYKVRDLNPKESKSFKEILYTVPSVSELVGNPPVLERYGMTWTEQLINDWGPDAGSVGCQPGYPCRPSVNYFPVWSKFTSQAADIDFMDTHQSKIEFTFGADSGTDDTYDISAMLDGGCGMHTNPMENDIGFVDIDGANIKSSCNSMPVYENQPINAPTIRKNNQPLQVSHNIQKYQKRLNKGKDESDYWKILERNNSDQSHGCINASKNFQSGRTNCPNIINNAIYSNYYACGWPDPSYVMPDGKSYYIDASKLKEGGIYNSPDLTNPVTKEEANTILTEIRNELYHCSKQQIINNNPNYIFREKYIPDSPVATQTFIDVEVRPGPLNGGSSDICSNKDDLKSSTCIYDPINLLKECKNSYTFNFDDSRSTSKCVPTNVDIPEYTITFCPDSTPPINNCKLPPPISPAPNSHWIDKGDYYKLNCETNYNPISTPHPTTSCNKGSWTTPYPSYQSNYCTPSPHECGVLTDIPNGRWNTTGMDSTFNCNSGYNRNFDLYANCENGSWSYTPSNYNTIGTICSPIPDPVDCQGHWSNWTSCSPPCGPSSVKTKKYTITTPSSNGGTSCPNNNGDIETEPCNINCCPQAIPSLNEFIPHSSPPNIPPNTPNMSVDITCQNNFERNSGKSVINLNCANGQWSIPPAVSDYCKCPDPTAFSGSWEKNQNTSIWHYHCPNGSYLKDIVRPTASCGDNGLIYSTSNRWWTNINDIQKNCISSPDICDARRPYDGFNGTWTEHGKNTLDFHCNKPTYIPSNQNQPIASCNQGRWTISPSPNNYCKHAPINCVGEWSSWTQCSPSCGPGSTKTRTYNITTEPSYGGSECDHKNGDTQATACNLGPCSSPGPGPGRGPGPGHVGGGGGGGSHETSGDGDYNRNRRDDEDKYTNSERELAQQTQQLQEQYQIAFDDHTPLSEINKQIYEFYKPNCSLHLNVDDDTIINNPGLLQLREYPGVGRCN